MIRPGALLLLLATLTLASPAGAQVFYEAPVTPNAEASDPIADLLDALPPDQSTDSAEPEPEVTRREEQEALLTAPFTPGAQPTAPVLLPRTPQAIPPKVPPAAITATPARPGPPRPTLDRPVMIDETGRSPDGPPTQIDLGYEARVRGSASSAQGLQGPLDGGWTVRGPDGAALYGLQLVDRSGGAGLEGAWRALGGSGRVGLIESLERQGSTLTVRINRGYGRPLTVLRLSAASDGGWVGDITDEAGTRAVTMRRN
ncbi:MAG: hypothetical protein Q8J89_06275 [Caulobacter sp.]|nr:hypothetical protein [Caulobacter sp.]